MLFSSEVLVLSKEKLGEIDLLLELLSPKGKIRAIAKGAQKSRRRFVNLLEEFNLLKAHFRKTKKGKLPILEKADLLFLPESIRYDYKKYIFFSYIGELISKISFSEQDVDYFCFIKDFIQELEKNEISWVYKPYFELKVLKLLGWEPQLFRCVKCGYKPKKIFYFSVTAGGILCYKCKDEISEFLEFQVIDILQNLIKMPLDLKNLLKFEKKVELSPNIKRKILKISEDFLRFFLFFDINSLKFLKETGGF